MIYKFSEILTIKNGKNQKKIENPLGKYPIYGSGGIIGYGNDYICEKDTVVIGRKGNINKPLYIEEPFWNVDTAFGLVADINILFPKYLYYFCVKYNFEKLNTTVTIPSLTKSNLLEIKIDLPNLFNQKEISKKLDKILKILELKKQQNSELDRLVKFQFLKMTGDLITNEKKWNFEIFKNICDIRDGTHDSPKYIKNGYPLITSKNITNGYLDFNNINYISKEDFDKINKRSKVDKGDIIMPMIGTIGKPLIINENIEFAIKNVALIKFNNSSYNNLFIKELLNSDYFYYIIKKNNRGGTQKFISLGDIRNILIPCIPIELQNKFAEFVKQVDKSKVIFEKTLKILDFGLNYFNVL